MTFAVTSLAAVAVGALLPVAQAHMAMWHPSMYGFGESYQPVTPLAGKSFGEWWFHGYASDSPSEVMSLPAGQSVTIEIACGKYSTSYGNSPSNDACPGDAGSYHAGGSTGSASGWSGNSDSRLSGCALAIAYKSSASATNPEDFTVMSVQENCVRQRDTQFDIPANLPACPEGGCTCAWFWQGAVSAEEMYMIGFRCDVKNGVATTSYPSPQTPKRGAISGATQPMYWANSNSNVDSSSLSVRPSYNSAWGWTNGAQTGAFGSGSGSGSGSSSSSGSGSGSGTDTSTDGEAATSTSRRGRWRQSATPTADWYNYAADPNATATATATDEGIAASEETAGSGSGSGNGGCTRRRKRRSRTRSNSNKAAHYARNADIAHS